MSGAELVTRPARPGDRHFLLAAIVALYADDAIDGATMDAARAARTIDALAARPELGRIEVLDVGGAAVGYAILTFGWSNELGGAYVVIDELWIVPTARGAGLGSRFVEQLAASDEGFVALILEVAPGNHRARALYDRLGFAPRPCTTMIRRVRQARRIE